VSEPAVPLWGPQTELALRHFAIGDLDHGERMPLEWVQALAQLKGIAAGVNGALGRLDAARAQAIEAAAIEVRDGRHDSQFPLSAWQSGSGTQSHMNVNEVLARLAGQQLPAGTAVHPNDHVNLGQSSNDMVPSAMHLATVLAVRARLLPALGALIETLSAQSQRHADVIKLGRTHLQDAVPLTLGQEIGAWRSQLAMGRDAVQAALPAVQALAIGGTAVGTGLNTHPDFARLVCEALTARTGIAFVPASDRFAALAGHEPLLLLHGALKAVAVALGKIANDVRLLASGPRAGLGELRLPENEPGSSIMPGKVNPTQCEALAMVCLQVMANDMAVTLGAAAGHLQLNTAKPLIVCNVLRSVRLLADAVRSFDTHAMQGLQADAQRIEAHLAQSLMLVTALTPHIGYERAAHIAQQAHAQGSTLREAALSQGVAASDFDRWTDPRQMLTTRAGPPS
jgi:fumarate hydratase, class II